MTFCYTLLYSVTLDYTYTLDSPDRTLTTLHYFIPYYITLHCTRGNYVVVSEAWQSRPQVFPGLSCRCCRQLRGCLERFVSSALTAQGLGFTVGFRVEGVHLKLDSLGDGGAHLKPEPLTAREMHKKEAERREKKGTWPKGLETLPEKASLLLTE